VFDGPLEVVHAPDLLDGPKHPVCHLFIFYPHHPEAHRSEEWLYDRIAQRPEGCDDLLQGPGRNDPGEHSIGIVELCCPTAKS
jgi:hypothetical protein